MCLLNLVDPNEEANKALHFFYQQYLEGKIPKQRSSGLCFLLNKYSLSVHSNICRTLNELLSLKLKSLFEDDCIFPFNIDYAHYIIEVEDTLCDKNLKRLTFVKMHLEELKKELKL